jgi:Holliday junction resolvasome RuvABC endonuclease subunit
MTATNSAAVRVGGSAVLGVDPSITATGVAWPSGDVATITPRPADGDGRLLAIEAALTDGFARYGVPDLAVIEDLPKHAHGAGITGMAQGVVRLVLRRHAIPYAVVIPSTLKKYATGKGTATKSDMRMALFKRLGIDLRDDNQVDAWWLRAMGLDALHDAPTALPKLQRDALLVVAWPSAAVPSAPRSAPPVHPAKAPKSLHGAPGGQHGAVLADGGAAGRDGAGAARAGRRGPRPRANKTLLGVEHADGTAE